MATQADVRRIALSLPGVEESKDRFGFGVLNRGKVKGIAWVWLERVAPKVARVPNPAVLGVRVANLAQKELILASDPKKFFTEPHYNGYPAVLVRLAAIRVPELRMLIEDAWRSQAPKELVAERVPAREKDTSTSRRTSKSAGTGARRDRGGVG